MYKYTHSSCTSCVCGFFHLNSKYLGSFSLFFIYQFTCPFQKAEQIKKNKFVFLNINDGVSHIVDEVFLAPHPISYASSSELRNLCA